ncbi:MAG: hypothetical protein IJA55_06940 [Clostridia bacterium]|nr:hypothetical protein [Clostridia bacterium]
MAVVITASVYQILSGYFGAGRTGNYLKIRSSKDRRAGYRILPIYKIILRRMGILYSIMLVLHIIFPLFYALVFSVLILLSDDVQWWSKDERGLKRSVLLMWQEASYSTRIFLLILLLAVTALVVINLFVFPLIFELVTGIFGDII